MDRYEARIRLHGDTARERSLCRLKTRYSDRIPASPAYRNVLLNGRAAALIMEDGVRPFMKQFLSLPGETIVPGDIVAWADRVWLVSSLDNDSRIYTRGQLLECNTTLYWQNDLGEIVCRPAYVVDAPSNGDEVDNNLTLSLASHRFLVHMPIDWETLSLENGKRIVIDNHDREPGVYELACPDRISLRFGEKGMTHYLFTQTPFNRNTDKLVTLETGEQIWLADYKDFPNLSPVYRKDSAVCSIVGDSILKVGYPKTYRAQFTDSSGETIPYRDFYFNIDSRRPELVASNVDGQEIRVEIRDAAMIGQTLTVQVIANGRAIDSGRVLAEKAVKIQALF